MKFTTNKLEQIKRSGYQLDFGQAFEQAFANYKKTIWISGAVILVLGIVFYALAFGITFSFLGISTLTDFTEFQEQGISITRLIVNLILGMLMALVIAPLSAGILQMAHNAETFHEFSFSTAFEHYKSKYIKDILLATFIVAFTTNVISFGTELALPSITSDGTLSEDYFWSKIIVFAISLIASLLTFFSAPLIIFGKLNAIEAIKGSITIVTSRFWIILLLLFVAGIYSILGIIACCIGMAFTLPFLYSMQYVIYRTAIDIEEENELDEIGFKSEL